MYHHVLVGTDGSRTADLAVESAARLAHRHQARLTVAHAFNPSTSLGTNPNPIPDELVWLATPGAAAEALVQSAIDLAQRVTCGGLQTNGRAEPGPARSVLRALVAELRPDAVVVGNADARGFLRRGIAASLAKRGDTDLIIVDTLGPRSRRNAA